MSADLRFGLGVLAATLAIPGALLATAPIAEARAPLGYLVGWGLALALVVPSYVVLSRVSRDPEDPRFNRALLGGTLGRFLLALVGMTLFATLVDDAPVKAFLLAFFLGWMLLTGLELGAVLRRRPAKRNLEA